MIQLTSRQQAVLGLLLAQSAPLSVKQIAARHHMGERTIRYDLEQVRAFLRERGGVLVQRPGVGVWVETPNDALRRELSDAGGGLGSPSRVLSREERCVYILRTLVLADSPVTADTLAEQMDVSRTTAASDLLQVDNRLKETRKLGLRGKKGAGFHLDGEESAIRALTVDTLLELIPAHYAVNRNALTSSLLCSIPKDGGELAMAAQYLLRVDMDTLSQLMTSSREVIPCNMGSTERMKFILYLAVLVARTRGGHRVTGRPGDEQADMDSRENQLAQLIAGRLGMVFRITLGDGEARLIAVWLIACNVKFSPKANDKIILELSQIVDDMLLALQDFPEYALPDFYRDKLKMNLVSHLKLTIKKYNLQISALNTLLTQMKVNYPEIFTVSYRMAERFERRTGIALGEDEIGFIAIHIAASVEEYSRLRSKRAIIVCNTGRGAAMVLYNRIRSNVPRLEIEGAISALDAMEPDALARVDLVISTIDLPQVEKPVLRVSPIVTAAELDGINRYLNGSLSGAAPAEGPQSQPRLTAGSYEEAAVMRCAMILARLGSVTGELGQLYGVELTTEKIFGLAIHLLMSIPRWEKGVYNREPAFDRFKEDHLEMFQFVAKLLREAAKECGISIPDKEALAIMRYFI